MLPAQNVALEFSHVSKRLEYLFFFNFIFKSLILHNINWSNDEILKIQEGLRT
jgi:hypothetical protein